MDEKLYLGFSMGFNSSAALVSNRRGVLAAVSQERLNGVKNTKEFPADAMIACCNIAKVETIDEIVYCHYQELTQKELCVYVGEKHRRELCEIVVDDDIHKNLARSIEKLLAGNSTVNKVLCSKVERMEHHTCHKASALAVYGEQPRYVSVTSDGFGDGISGRIEVTGFNKSPIGLPDVISEVPLKDSIALVYQFVTGALGFKEHQHEGKITGLAAFGTPYFVNDFKKALYKDELFVVDLEKLQELTEAEVQKVEDSTIVDFDHFLRLKKTVYNFVESLIDEGCQPQDIAASVQCLAEEYVTKWIYDNVSKYFENKTYETIDVYLAGGLFANVKINQRVRELTVQREGIRGIAVSQPMFSQVLVAPPMGDEGTAMGAAWWAMSMEEKRKAYEKSNFGLFNKVNCMAKMNSFGTVTSGTIMMEEYDELFAESMCSVPESKNSIHYERMESEEARAELLAKFLSEKKIVCLCEGRMEFGPRALCHRSILYDCTSKETNDWLNKQLSRTEFMPFAPVCMERDADSLFEGFYGGRNSARFMTMTFNCSEEFLSKYHAAYHVDGTARPQVVNETDDEFMFQLLREYKGLTGNKVLINTSFNLHNHPIVESAEQAFSSWMKSNTDVLCIGQHVFVRRNLK